MTMTDHDLVRRYAQSNSEEAFAALVSRYVDLVYSVALRQVRDPHLAEDITQAVFVILARKAASLSSKTVVSGWLCRTARYTAAKALTMQRRRQSREHETYMQSALNDSQSASNWTEIAPFLDSAMAELGQKDHDALVVRFFHGRCFREVSAALGTTEAGAKMRVNRALEKLRNFFVRRGVSLSVAAIATAVSAYSVQAAPSNLAASAALAALKGTVVTTSTLTLAQMTLKLMTWIKIKTAAAVGAACLLAVGTTTIAVQHALAANETAKPAFAGYKTPEATVKSLIYALSIGDTNKFAAACTPAHAERFLTQLAGRSEEQLKREAKAQASALEKFEIQKKEEISDSEVHLHIKMLGDTTGLAARGAPLVAIMKKIGSDWKYDGDVRQ
jgi:RNA polymerase sigma factor (sigma-70 family)